MRALLIAKSAQFILDVLYHLYENKMVSIPGLKLIHENVLHNAVLLDAGGGTVSPEGSKQLDPSK